MYDNYFKDKKGLEKFKSNKILCVLEGKDELNFIRKIYEILENDTFTCEDIINTKIKISWGKTPIKWLNKEQCNFQGGNLKGCSTPYPILESLNNEDIELYKAILIMFDADCDEEKTVYENSKEIVKDYQNFILYSVPCFEKEMISFVSNENTKEYIKSNYMEIEGSKCRWYKNNLSKIPKKENFKHSQSLESTIRHLTKIDFNSCSVELKNLKKFIEVNLG